MYRFVKPNAQLLSTFKEVRVVKDDVWNRYKNGEVKLSYFDKYNNHIGYIQYRIFTGQVDLFYIYDIKHRRTGLGKQMLNKAIADMFTHETLEIWAVTYEHHAFWANVWKKSFKFQNILHPSVRGSGYRMTL